LRGVEQIVTPVMIHIHKYEASQTSVSLVLCIIMKTNFLI